MFHTHCDLIWCTLVQKRRQQDRSSDTTVIVASSCDDNIAGVKTLNPAKISHTLENVYRLLVQCTTMKGPPPRKLAAQEHQFSGAISDNFAT